MQFPMPLWTSCLERDCLVLELGRRKAGGPATLGQYGRCRKGENGECASRRAWSPLGLERKAVGAVSNTRPTIE